MNLIKWFRRRAAIRKYVNVLGPALVKNYGKKRTYRTKEVIDTVLDLKLTETYIFYALALYCAKKDYEAEAIYPQSMVIYYAMAKAVAFNIALAQNAFSDTSSSISDGGDGDGCDS